MEIHFNFDESDPDNTRITVSVNGSQCGEISLTTEDANGLTAIVKSGCSQVGCDFDMSGELYKSESWVMWHKRSGKERRSGTDRRSGGDRRDL